MTIARSGGFAGVSQTVEISADGKWTYTDRRAGTTEEGQLTPDQHARLQAALVNPDFTTQLNGTGGPNVCADTFRYSIIFDSKRGVYDDCDRGAKPAVVAVVAAAAEATPL